MDLYSLSITESLEKLKQKKLSSVELTTACLNRIKKTNKALNALITVTDEAALDAAKHADLLRAQGENLPLLGIPMVIKDNFCTKGVRTTASSKVLDNFIPPYNATVTERLLQAGIVMLGKANMDAWAHGSSTETSDYGPSKNPWNKGYLPGGSSGGTAASVAADQAIGGIGSETAGSIRQPASWCGIVGLKPTYGRVSRYGVIAMGSSLDSPGPMTKTVSDSALVLQVLAGKDPLDATSLPHEVPNYSQSRENPLAGVKIGISDDYFEGVDKEVVSAVTAAIKEYEKLGATIKKIKLFQPKYAIAVYTILQRSEVSSNLARYDGIRYGYGRDRFGDEAKRRIMLGTFTLSAGYYDAYYKKALQVRTLIIDDFKRAFQDVDVIMGPTSPSTALPLGSSKNHPMFGEMADVLVEPSSIAGLPGINIPCGFSKNNLPIGLQIIGPKLSEQKLINIAYKFEKATDYHTKKPSL
ncbi:MAG: Asp-tRNA(Asn)/Glu-tRNA(Gln) amidotransferase subunit GatA [Candidatus Levybacteria bacterium]|nr:Asp-tRNA(Asn)/Glu-tRNA(Gln) amidotransferase subunit GatA [Candidatus Levybacteria bacterium]